MELTFGEYIVLTFVGVVFTTGATFYIWYQIKRIKKNRK
jgi:hypothetical protein